MLEKQRHKVLLSILNEHHYVSVRKLSELLNASEATVRRDLTKLSNDGMLLKIRGGAEAINQPMSDLPQITGSAFVVQKELYADAKRAIAKRAVDLCQEGDSITINAGSSTYMMGEFLRQKQMPILTNSFELASELVKNSNNQVTVPGGEIYRKQNIILSAFDNDVIQHYHSSKMFMGTPGVGDFGVMESDPLLVRAEQKLMKQADSLVVLADSSKLGRRSNFILCSLDEVDILITDSKASDKDISLFEKHGIEVLVVELES